MDGAGARRARGGLHGTRTQAAALVTVGGLEVALGAGRARCLAWMWLPPIYHAVVTGGLGAWLFWQGQELRLNSLARKRDRWDRREDEIERRRQF